MLIRAIFAVVLSATLALPAAARDMTAAEKNSLKTTIDRYVGAVRKRQYRTMARSLPPTLVKHLAAKAKRTPKAFVAASTRQTVKFFKTVKLESYAMTLKGAFYRTDSEGTPFVMIPTTTVMNYPKRGRFEIKNYTLALIEGGKWHLVQVAGKAQGELIKEVYPSFKKIRFPGQSVNEIN